MDSSNLAGSRIGTFLARAAAVLFFPVALPVLIAANYRGLADRLTAVPGIRSGGGIVPGIAAFVYIMLVVGLAAGASTVTIDPGGGNSESNTNAAAEETATPDEITAPTATVTPSDSSISTPTAKPTPTEVDTDTKDGQRNKYELLLSDVEENYSSIARNSYPGPYLSFINGSYDTARDSVTLNFSMDDHDSVNRYERTVSGSAGVYVWVHFHPKTAYPKEVTLNYFRQGNLNASGEIKPRWMRQYMFGNVSPDTPAPMSYQTYVRVVMGTLNVSGEKTEFPHLLSRCEEEHPLNSGECKNSLRERMPVRFYLPERTATGGPYTNIMGNAQPVRSFDSREDRLAYTARKLEENITGTVSLEGYTPADDDRVWKNVDMRIRDVYLQNETIVVEQYTRSEVGDDSLPLRQNDVIGAKYGRLVVNYGAQFMPANGVVIIKYTPDGQKYSKVRVQNYNAVGYINGERGLVELGLDVETIEQYQEPGS